MSSLLGTNTRNVIQFNTIQLFIIYVPSQQLQGQLQADHSAVICIYIMDRHNIKSRINYRNTIIQKKIDKQSEISNINCKQNIRIAK
jgi:hypothetical protein